MWNKLIKIRDTTSDPEVKRKAEAYLSALNTAGGRRISREVEFFIQSVSDDDKEPFKDSE